MALDLGALMGRIGLDIGPFESGVDKAQDKLGDFKAKGVAIAATAGVAIAATLGAGLVSALDAQPAQQKLVAQLGADGAWAGDLGKIAGEVYAGNFGDSLEQVNEALRQVMQNGILPEDATNAQIEAVTSKVLALSDVMDQDLGATSRAVGQLMKTGMAKDADEALDIITRGFQQGADRSEDFLDTLNEYGTQFRKLGIDGATATGLITQGIAAGARDGDIVADAIKEFSIRAIDGSEATGDAFKAIGLNAKTMSADIAAGGPRASAALQKTLDALRGVKDPAAQSAAAVGLFGTQAEDLGAALFKLDPSRAAKGLGDVEGAAQKLSDTAGATATGNIESMKRQLIVGLGEVGNRVLPGLTSLTAEMSAGLGPAMLQVAESAGEALTWLSEHDTVTKALAITVASVLVPALVVWGVTSTVSAARAAAAWTMAQIAAVRSAGAQVAAAGRAVAAWVASTAQTIALMAMYAAGSVASAATATASWVASSARTVGALALQSAGFIASRAVMVGGAVATGVMTAAQWALNVAMSANPIALVVIAIAALVAGIVIAYKNSETFRNIVNAAWAGIQVGVMAVVNWLTTAVPAVFSWIRTAFLRYTPLGIIISHWGQIRAFIAAAVAGIVATLGWFASLPGKFSTWWGGVRTAVSTKFAEVVTYVKGIPKAILSAIGNLNGLLEEKGRDIVWGLIEGIRGMAGELASFVKDFVTKNIPEPVAKAMGIRSPSRVMAEMARWIPLGMVEGIKQTSPQLNSAMANLVDPSLTRTGLPLTAAAGGRGAGMGGYGRPVEQHFHIADTDPYTVARESSRRVLMGV